MSMTEGVNILDEIVAGFKVLFNKQSAQMVTVLRQPTPIKISRTVQADASGNIGSPGGLISPIPIDLWSSPVSHESWINRCTITSPGHSPASPLTTGEVWLTTNTGVPIYFFPIGGVVAPVQINEGRLSAPHLSPGEQIVVAGDQLPAVTTLIFNFQITLVSGISPDAPWDVDGEKAIME